MVQEITDSLVITTGTPFDNIISTSGGIRTIFNNNNRDIDFQIKSTGINSSLYYDASAGRLGIGITGAPDAALHVVTPCAREGLILESNTNCSTGVVLLLLHKPGNAPQVGSYPSTINFAGRDYNSNVINYAQIKSKILGTGTLQTSGEIIFSIDHTGLQKEVFVANMSKLVLGADNSVSGADYNLIGKSNYASGLSYLLIGNNNSGTLLNNSYILGDNNTLRGPNLFLLSSNSNITGSKIFSIGNNNDIVGNSGLVFGSDSSAYGSYNLLLLDNSSVQSSSSIGIIKNGDITGSSGVILGSNIISSGTANINIGNSNLLYGNRVTAIGSNIASEGNSNLVFGNVVLLSGNNIVSIGSNQNVNGIINGILLGNNINLSDTSNILYLGFNNQTDDSLNNSVILGGNNYLNDGVLSHIILLGQNNATKDMQNSILVGNSNIASGDIKNNIVIGSGNAFTNNSYNTICIGTLTNQTGVYVDADGGVTGSPKSISSVNNNSVIIGIQNQSYSNISNTIIGNKNKTSGLYLNNIGSFNDVINSSKTYILGNSNVIEGNNLAIVGSNTFAVSDNSIVVNNRDDAINAYGSGIIMVGNNPNVSSGNIVVGYDNRPGVSGLIYGKNNRLGISRDFFTYSSGNNNLIVLNRSSAPHAVGDTVLLHVKNPIFKNNVIHTTINSVSNNIDNGTTTIALASNIPWSDRYYVANNSFDDDNSASTVGSGWVILLESNDQYYGANNTIFGNNNNIALSDGIVIGNNNFSSGNNSVIIGNNITGVSANTVSIGTSNQNKVVISDSTIVFNTGTAQDSIVARATDGTITQFLDLSTKRLGINTSSPRSDLDVSGTITTQYFRMGLSATPGHVLTTSSSGTASWELPVKISGNVNGLLFNDNANNKSIYSTAISDGGIKVVSTKDFDNNDTYSLNFYDNFYIHKTGIEINTQKGEGDIDAVALSIYGSGGDAYGSTPIFKVDPKDSLVSSYNLYSFSGSFEQLNITSHLRLPTIASGTIIAMSGNRSLIGRVLAPYSVIYSNAETSATGNRNFRWFDSNRILAIAPPNSPVNDDTFLANSYNIILSSSGNQDTVFNNRGLGNNFSIMNSGSTEAGLHVLAKNGKVGINTTITSLDGSPSYANATLCVGGKTVVDSLKITSAVTSGQYLRVADNGDIVASAATLESAFNAPYPLKVTENIASKAITVSISEKDNNNSTDLNVNDIGRVLSWNGNWIVASGFHLYSDVNNKKGTIIGYDGSLFDTVGLTTELGSLYSYANVYAGGSFDSRAKGIATRGTTQFSQFFLRTRTTDNSTKIMLSDWSHQNQTSKTVSNTITFPANAYGVWSYTAYVNVLYSGTYTAVSGAAYIINGAVGRFSNNNAAMIDLGYTTNLIGVNSSPAHNVIPKISVVGSNNACLDFQVSGDNGFTMLWSATVNINQLHWRIGSSLNGAP